MSKWISVKDKLPEKTGIYAACMTVHSIPTYLIYLPKTKRWMVTINNTYWEVTKVKFWQPAPPTPKMERTDE